MKRKSTGIIRRIDDLGRVVVPKEIRRVLNIQEGDPLEYILEDDGVFLQKYSPLTFNRSLGISAITLFRFTGKNVIICDKDEVLTSYPPHPKFRGRISDELFALIENRVNYVWNLTDPEVTIKSLKDSKEFRVLAMSPIVNNSDVVGCIAFISNDYNEFVSSEDFEKLKMISFFLQIEMME